MTQEPVESWEKEYDRQFDRGIFVNNLTGEASYSRIKFFIENLLTSQKQKQIEEFVSMLEGQRIIMAQHENDNVRKGLEIGAKYFNKKIDKLINKLKGDTK